MVLQENENKFKFFSMSVVAVPKIPENAAVISI